MVPGLSLRLFYLGADPAFGKRGSKFLFLKHDLMGQSRTRHPQEHVLIGCVSTNPEPNMHALCSRVRAGS